MHAVFERFYCHQCRLWRRQGPRFLAPLEWILLRSTSIYPCIYPWVCPCIHGSRISGHYTITVLTTVVNHNSIQSPNIFSMEFHGMTWNLWMHETPYDSWNSMAAWSCMKFHGIHWIPWTPWNSMLHNFASDAFSSIKGKRQNAQQFQHEQASKLWYSAQNLGWFQLALVYWKFWAPYGGSVCETAFVPARWWRPLGRVIFKAHGVGELLLSPQTLGLSLPHCTARSRAWFTKPRSMKMPPDLFSEATLRSTI